MSVLPYRVLLRLERHRLDAEERILAYLMDHPWSSGYIIGKGTSMRPSRVYPALDRLMAASVLWARWQPLEPGKKHRRRLYDIVPEAKP